LRETSSDRAETVQPAHPHACRVGTSAVERVNRRRSARLHRTGHRELGWLARLAPARRHLARIPGIDLGALAGIALGYKGGSFVIGAIAGAIGAVIGTLAGHEGRARLAAAFSSDWSVALIGDAVAIIGALVIVLLVR
jgi:hypothetical protein